MDTVKIYFVKGDQEFEVNAQTGLSLLEVAHQNKVPLKGECEGSLACSTCHVIADQETYDNLEEPSEDELDMLDYGFGVQLTSRLGCQVIVDKKMEGKKFVIPDGTVNFTAS